MRLIIFLIFIASLLSTTFAKGNSELQALRISQIKGAKQVQIFNAKFVELNKLKKLLSVNNEKPVGTENKVKRNDELSAQKHSCELYLEKNFGLIPGLRYITIPDAAELYLVLTEKDFAKLSKEDVSKVAKGQRFLQTKLTSSKAILAFKENIKNGQRIAHKLKGVEAKLKLKTTEALKDEKAELVTKRVNYNELMRKKYGIHPNVNYEFVSTATSVYFLVSKDDLKSLVKIQERTRKNSSTKMSK